MAEFEKWLKQNSHIYDAFEEKAKKIWEAGYKHFGQRCIWESIRYETSLREKDSDYKLNNNYLKGCALLFIEKHPECKGLFSFRDREDC